MQQNVTQVLYTYWNELRGDRLAPRRFDIEPSQIAKVLPHTFILERIDPDTLRFRLAGTRLCEQFGRELRSENFLEIWSAEDRLTMQRQLAVMARHGAVGAFDVQVTGADKTKHLFEMIVLPLIHSGNTIDRFLGAISPSDTVRAAAEPLAFDRLLDNDLLWPDGRPHAMIDNVDRQVPFLPHLRNARVVKLERRQFRVYDGGLAKPSED